MSEKSEINKLPTIERVFDLLDAWRHLPAYQLERRADIFFALFLPEVLEKHFNIALNPILVPEFPIRKSNVNRTECAEEGQPSAPESEKDAHHLSNKIDYFALSENREHAFLIELKTDMKSIDKKQICLLKRAAKRGLHCLVKGVLKLCSATDEKAKYVHLLWCLSQLGLVKHKHRDGEENVREVLDRLYENAASVAPCHPNRRSEAISRGKRFAKALRCVKPARMISWPEIQPVYIQPRQCEDEDQGGLVVIDFETFAKTITRPSLEKSESKGIRHVFACYLRKWAAVDAGSPNPRDGTC